VTVAVVQPVVVVPKVASAGLFLLARATTPNGTDLVLTQAKTQPLAFQL
jgi:hypothetical protein